MTINLFIGICYNVSIRFTVNHASYELVSECMVPFLVKGILPTTNLIPLLMQIV